MKLLLSLLSFLVLTMSDPSLTAQEASTDSEPLKVFILVGQSNMQGHARIHTLQHVGTRDKTKPIYEMLTEPDGSPTVHKNVWINSLSSNDIKKGNLTAGFGANEEKIGPELAFGARMQQLVGEPILIIKTAWGGKSLHTDFRPPGAGEFVFSKQQLARFRDQKKDLAEIRAKKKDATGKHYRLMLEHVQAVLGDIKSTYPDYDAKRGYELAGMVWFQGWNDMVDSGIYPKRDQKGGYDQYSKLLSQFIRDVRRDLKTPKLPFVIGVMGVGGPTSQYDQSRKRMLKVHQNFRDAMAAPAAMPEFQENVTAVLTEKYWDEQLGELRTRQGRIDGQIRKARKEGQLDHDAAQKLREKLYAEEFSQPERQELEQGVSNLEYHYLGSATILTQIGQGFADAMHELTASSRSVSPK